MHACGHDAHTCDPDGRGRGAGGDEGRLAGRGAVRLPAGRGRPARRRGRRRRRRCWRRASSRDFKPEAVFGLHVFSTLNAGQIGVRSGPMMAASDRFNIKVKGRQTHGSRPWGGIDPIVAAADLIGSAQTIVSRRHEHLEAAGGGQLRRDQGRHPLQHHSRPGRTGRHDPHLRRGHAPGGVRRPQERRRTRRRRARRERRRQGARTPRAIRSPSTIRR